ncbi:hypothetical protein AN4142.2 [Aspergillus nidulans FGSC A4]|nr:hypothetical protein AN4142.2 [Aspergillus nidulans FGSC A4]|eukprot:XP_661746.1 hypothetical protein AN4142.2 [Aspergillus nidulans FGSC A4]
MMLIAPISRDQDVPPRRSFRSIIWDTDTHFKTPKERHLLLKLDIAMLSIGCLGFFMKYLDHGNLSNAYVSGMQEALSMFGNEYTYAQTMYTIAFAIMQIPSTLIIQRVRRSIWLAAMEICWGAFTFAQAGLKSVSELYAFRFLVYGLLPNGILAFWPASLALKEFAFLIIGVQLMTAVFYSWANEVCADNNEQRAVVIRNHRAVLTLRLSGYIRVVPIVVHVRHAYTGAAFLILHRMFVLPVY